MTKLRLQQEVGSKGVPCGVARRRGDVLDGASFLGGSELGENLLGDLRKRQKPKKGEKPQERRYGNYKGRRHLILKVKASKATIERLDGSERLTVAFTTLQDVSTVRESKQEVVCYICDLPWSVCEVGGRDKRGIPFSPSNPIDYGQ